MKNESIIQLGGKSYIKSRVVMLPTEKDSRLYLNLKDLPALYMEEMTGDRTQALYFLTSEEIKEGDWYMDGSNVFQSFGKEFTESRNRLGFKKIIASTDKSLDLHSDPKIINDKGKVVGFSPLPHPSNEFLQAYCKANGRIEEVLIEVEVQVIKQGKAITDSSEKVALLKISPDNTITIKKVEDTFGKPFASTGEKAYSRDEVITLLGEARLADIRGGSGFSLEKWISENLK